MGDRGLTQEDLDGVWTTASPQPAGGPTDLSRSSASQPKALIGRSIKAAAMDLPGLILIGFLVMLAVMA